jgi:hypothetical protein
MIVASAGEGARLASRIRNAIDEGSGLFEGVAEDATARSTTPGGWCAREIIGHLIDSACNNHRRFIVNQDASTLVVEPYDQEKWVALSHYAETPAAVLVATWRAYNDQIARVIERVPDETLGRGRGPRASYRFPYVTYALSDEATLRDLIEDYIGHLHHHFRQIRAVLHTA